MARPALFWMERTSLRSRRAQKGMRVWTADETRLVEASRRAEEQRTVEELRRTRQLNEAKERQRQAEAGKQRETEQRLKEQEESNKRLRKRAVALLVSLAGTVGVAGIATQEWREAGKERDEVSKQRDEANKETTFAKAETNRANQATDKAIAAAKERKAKPAAPRRTCGSPMPGAWRPALVTRSRKGLSYA